MKTQKEGSVNGSNKYVVPTWPIKNQYLPKHSNYY